MGLAESCQHKSSNHSLVVLEGWLMLHCHSVSHDVSHDTSTYMPSSQSHTISFGTGDSDSYTYDPNTGRLKNYTFNVNGATDSGGLTWNANGTLGQLLITDGINSGGSQTCTYGGSVSTPGYDDLGRLLNVSCGALWSQAFSYDPYGNITKSGSSAWAPGYSETTNHASTPITYDNNGNMTNDTLRTYAYYVDNKLGSINSTTCNIFGSTDGTCILYDAFGREVERGVNGVYTEVMYTPAGKTAVMNGQTTTVNAYFPLPGGATYYQSGSTGANQYFWHKDWLGSARLSSSITNRTSYFDRAFAPFGESYNNFGNAAGLDFTGDTQDSFAALLYDTSNRELHPGQGRWLSPDPAGLGAVDPTNPQTWNRYAYALNNPLSNIDPTGLYCEYYGDSDESDEGASFDFHSDQGTCEGNGPEGGGKWFDDPTTTVTVNGDTGEVDTVATFTGNDGLTPLVTTQTFRDCNNPPALPLGQSVDFNIQQTKQASQQLDPYNLNTGTRLWWFKDMVTTGGAWDYKQGGHDEFVDAGNFNYGATCGAMGETLYFCQSMAGANKMWRSHAQGRPQGKGFPFLKPPYGDQSSDQRQIAQGFAYNRSGTGCQ